MNKIPPAIPNHHRDLYNRACRVIPGGVNSPVRSFGAVGDVPLFIQKGEGSRIFSNDNRVFIDFCGSWGPLILGHRHPDVVEAVQRAAANGLSFGTCTAGEVELAELLCSVIPGMEQVRLLNSGTEACMTAIRLARGFTGRKKILKFDGCYHGHSDSMLVSAGSGLLQSGIASSAGVPAEVSGDTHVVPFNDLGAVHSVMAKHGEDVAAIIVEPVAANMGLVLPNIGFLEDLEKTAKNSGALLILDEVITGFRLGPTDYGSLFGIKPDLTCLGKIVGGGMPLAACGGKAEIMSYLAPLGPVYQAGTLSGNPVAVAAGLTTLKTLIKENPYPSIKKLGTTLAEGMTKIAREYRIDVQCVHLGSMFTIFFGKKPILGLEDARQCNKDRYATFFHGMLEQGIYLPPSPFETCFISTRHTDEDIRFFLAAAREVISAI